MLNLCRLIVFKLGCLRHKSFPGIGNINMRKDIQFILSCLDCSKWVGHLILCVQGRTEDNWTVGLCVYMTGHANHMVATRICGYVYMYVYMYVCDRGM